MKNHFYIAQNRSYIKPKLKVEQCVTMPEGCAVSTNEHPRWNDTNNVISGTNNFGLNFLPNGGLVTTSVFGVGDEIWRYAYLGSECIIWVDGQYSGGGWDTKNAQTLWNTSSWFFEYIGAGGGYEVPRARPNNALAIKPCKNYTGYDVPDGTKFYNAYKDGDGNYYNAIKIGDMLWVDENLKTTKLQDGTPILLGESQTDFKNNDDTPLYTYYNYNNVVDLYGEYYGGLYNWYCIKNDIVDGDGWRVPNMRDLNKIRTFLLNTIWCNGVVVGNLEVSQYIKSCRQVDHPLSPCVEMPEGCAISTNEHPRWDEDISYYGNDNLKFSALPSGMRDSFGSFTNIGKIGYYRVGIDRAVRLRFDDNAIGGFSVGYHKHGFSVRCVKDYVGDEPNGTIFYADYKDGDNNYYDSVVIGNQLWITKNLYSTRYQNGTSIENITNDSIWGNLTSGGYCWYSNDYSTYGQHYGALYNWYAVDSGLVDYNGYRVSTEGDWNQLNYYVYLYTNWCNGIVVNANNVGQYLKSCRQVDHPLADMLFHVDIQEGIEEVKVYRNGNLWIIFNIAQKVSLPAILGDIYRLEISTSSSNIDIHNITEKCSSIYPDYADITFNMHTLPYNIIIKPKT